MDHLVIVPCHGIYRHGPPEQDSSWFIAEFQAGESKEFCTHIRTACELASRDNQATLVFSGGQTKLEAGPISEAGSYMEAAVELGLLGESLLLRIQLEEYSRDSMENLAYSISCYRESHEDQMPSKITVVGWGFKEERFRRHAAALGVSIEYVGCGTPTHKAAAEAGEARTLAAYHTDPLGNSGELLAKRRTRNPFARQIPYKDEICARLVW
eukprot:m.107309 g.107309  ORF g.107309 m.107309 type:complete len:212 (+) comp8977_c1_seq1:4382-5017(+)